MRIYIIRHGETERNKAGVLQGWTDDPLNEAGRELAAITGRNMRPVKFDVCISSPLKRARETAEIVLRESGNGSVPVEFDDRIREISFGIMENHRLDCGLIPLSEARLFLTDPFQCKRFPGGENVRDVAARTQEFLKELCARDDGKTYLVTLHGCCVRAMLNMLYEDPQNYWHGRVPYNCAVNIVDAEKGSIRLIEDDKLYYDPSLAVDRYKLD